MASPAHQRAISEVQQWLGYRGLDEFVYTLLDNGYDDLDAIAYCNAQEAQELQGIFKTQQSRNNIKALIEALQEIGIEPYRKSKSQFVQVLSTKADPEAGASPAAAVSSPAAAIAAITAPLPSATPAAAPAPSSGRSKSRNLEAYFSIKTAAAGQWIDKHVTLEGAQIRWLTSRKENKIEEAYDLTSDVQAAEAVDGNTIRLTLKAGGTVDLWSNHSVSKWHSAITASLGHYVEKEEKDEEVESSEDEEKTSKKNSKGGEGAPKKKKKQKAEKAEKPAGGEGDQAEDSESSEAVSDTESESGDEGESLPPPPADGKVATFDDAVVTSAYERAVLGMQGIRPIDQSTQIAKAPEREYSENERKLQAMFKMLKDGEFFKKYKRGRSDKRRISCSEGLDFVCWGDENSVKGFMPTKEIQEINQGFGKDKNRIFVVSPTRTLELEAKDTKMAKEWKIAFEVLMKSSKLEQNKRGEVSNSVEWKENLKAWTDEHTQLLVVGDVFKKWPGRKKVQKGKFTCRKIWATPKLDKVNWSDISSQKVKGYINFDEIVDICEDNENRAKFSIIAKGRTLDLEAKSVWVREKWVRGFRFFVYFRKTHAGGAE